MLSNVLGDIVGSRFEFFATQEKEVKLFHSACSWTDDSVCTYAVANVCEIIKNNQSLTDEKIEELFFREFKNAIAKFPEANYGKKFYNWAKNEKYVPGDSAGNGCLMRLSPIIIAFNDERLIKKVAVLCTKTSHNHPDSIQSVLAYIDIMIYLKNDIKSSINEKKINVKKIAEDYGYEILSVEKYNDLGGFYGLAKDTLPRAISVYLEGDGFYKICQNVLYVGTDTDTNAAIAGSMSELTYGINSLDLNEFYRYFDHKSFCIVQNICKLYFENKKDLSEFYSEEIFRKIEEIYNYKALDQTALWDPLELPSDEEYYGKMKKYAHFSFVDKILNWFKFR